jgi:hypothetical protein
VILESLEGRRKELVEWWVGLLQLPNLFMFWMIEPTEEEKILHLPRL